MASPMETLKRCECEVGNLLENSLLPLHADDRAALEDLHQQVKSALLPPKPPGKHKAPPPVPGYKPYA